MGLFNFFKKGNQVNNTEVVGLPNVEDNSKEILPEIRREDFVDDSEPNLESNTITILSPLRSLSFYCLYNRYAY